MGSVYGRWGEKKEWLCEKKRRGREEPSGVRNPGYLDEDGLRLPHHPALVSTYLNCQRGVEEKKKKRGFLPEKKREGRMEKVVGDERPSATLLSLEDAPHPRKGAEGKALPPPLGGRSKRRGKKGKGKSYQRRTRRAFEQLSIGIRVLSESSF